MKKMVLVLMAIITLMMIRIPAAQAAKCESMYDSLSVDDPVAVDGRFVVNNLGEETVTGIMKSGEFPAYVTRLGRKAFYKTKVVSMSQKTEALKVRLLFSAPNNVEIDISKNDANQFLYPWVNSGSPGGALDRSCVEARLTPEELGETNVAAAPPPLPTSAAAVNTIAAEYDVVYDPSHECSDSQEAWTKVLRDYVPQYDPKVHGLLEQWRYAVGYSTEGSSLHRCPAAQQLTLAEKHRKADLEKRLQQKGWDTARMFWAGGQSNKAGGFIERVVPGPQGPPGPPGPQGPAGSGGGGGGGELGKTQPSLSDRVFVFGGPEVLWTNWGLAEKPVDNNWVKREKADSLAAGVFAGLGFALGEAFALTGQGRWDHVFVAPKTRDNTWSAGAALMWAPIYDLNFSLGGDYFWSGVAWHEYDLKGERNSKVESAQQAHAAEASVSWVFTKTQPAWFLRGTYIYGQDFRARDPFWGVGVGIGIRFGGRGNFVPEKK